MRSVAARLYVKLFAAVFYFRCRRRRVTYEQPLPEGGSIFIANHLITRGPLYVMCYMPVPVHIWTNATIMDRGKFVDDISRRYLEPVLGIPRLFSRAVARVVHVAFAPLLRGVGTIPVHNELPATHRTFARSLALLREGKSIVIFPEYFHNIDSISHFHKGVGYLIKRFYRETGRAPNVIPMAIDQRANMLIGKTVVLDEPTLQRPDDCTRVLEKALRGVFQRLGTER